MKRALLIAGGTVGGLGAVLSVTPPQLGSQGLTNLASSANGAGSSTISATRSIPTVAVVPQATSTVVKASASSATPPTKLTATPTRILKKKAAAPAKKADVKVTKNAPVKKKVAPAAPQSSTLAVAPAPVVATKSAAPSSNSKKISGTFVGSSVFVNYGTVQVEITVVDGKITDAHALQAPSGRSDRFTQYAIPVLRQQTLAAQSASIQGASGASYTSWGWFTSLEVAIARAGL